MANPGDNFVGVSPPPRNRPAHFSKHTTKKRPDPSDRAYPRVTVLQRQTCEQGPKLEGKERKRKKKRPQEGSSEHRTIKQERAGGRMERQEK